MRHMDPNDPSTRPAIPARDTDPHPTGSATARDPHVAAKVARDAARESRGQRRLSDPDQKKICPVPGPVGCCGQPHLWRHWRPRCGCPGRRATTARTRAVATGARVVVLGPSASTGLHMHGDTCAFSCTAARIASDGASQVRRRWRRSSSSRALDRDPIRSR